MGKVCARISVAAIALFLCLWGSVPATAQTDRASIRGVVSDPSGAVVPDAVVRLIDVERGTQAAAVSDSGGRYTFASVRPGNYELEVEKQGFKLVRLSSLSVNVLDTIEHNVVLEIGPFTTTERVDVTAPKVETSGAVSTVIDHQFVDNIPLNGRSIQTLIMLTPGVVVTPTSLDDQGQFSVNGQRADANYLMVDGVSANFGVTSYFPLVQAGGGALPALSASGGTNSLVSVDALQEFRVQTSSFAPEFGRTPGGQVAVVTRSGTNAMHGSVFEYFRDGALDENDWFAKKLGLPKPDERQNDFGGVLGGPLVRDRTFFFASYEGLRLRQPKTRESVVPDLASRQEAPTEMRPFLNAYPLPSGAAKGPGLAEFNGSYSDPSSLDASSIRIDHAVNNGLHVFGRYNYSPSSLDQRAAPFTTPTLSTVERIESSIHTATFGITQLFGRSLTHEPRVNYSRHRMLATFHVDDFGGAVPVPDALMFPSGFTSETSAFLLLISGVGQFGQGIAGVDEQQQVNIVDNLGLAKGRHDMKFGVDYRWLAPSSSPFVYRQFVQFTGVHTAPGGAISGTAAFAQPATFQADELRSHNVSLFGQDSWRVSPQLTVTYGLRWDINPPLTGTSTANDPMTVLGVENPATMTLAPRGTPLYETTYGNVAPRVGAAYELGSTIVRGGFGTFYDLGYGALGGTSAFFPYSASRTLLGVPFPLTPANAAPPALSTNPPVDQIVIADPHLKLPRTYQWNVAVEQSFGRNQTVSVTYLGAAGRDLLRATTMFLPNPQFQVVSLTTNTATSDYDSLQVQLDRRFSRGLQVLASYTWSHSMDIASTDALSAYANTPVTIDDPSVDRADSDFDIRHAFSAGATYLVPTFGSDRVVRALLGGWSLDSTVFGRSAPPVNIVGGLSFAGASVVRYRPNVNPGVPLELFGEQYPGGKIFNAAAFTLPPAGQQGNLPRNTLRGFDAFQIDLAVQRHIRVNQQFGVRLRAEVFNLFNRTNFGSPVNDLTSPLFGYSTQTLANSLGSGGFKGGFNPLYQVGGPRSIQLALRLEF